MNEKTVGMLAKFTGVSVHTIKYYEKIGLLSSTRREHSNYRSYDIRACTDIYECMKYKNLGVAILNDKGIIKKLVEKPKEPISNLALTGLYHIINSKELFEAVDYIIKNDIKTKNEYQLTDALEYMIERGLIFKTFKLEGWFDCGEKSTMIETNRLIIKNKILSDNIKDSAIVPPVFIDKDVKIESSVIGPYVHIGKNSQIENSILKNCIMFEEVNISNVLMDDCIVSEKAKYKGKTNSMDIGASITIEQN